MKCKNCEFEYQNHYDFCPNCGTPRAVEQPTAEQPTMVEAVSLNPAADRVMPALRDKLFLALCILMTAACALSLASSGMPLLNILITVFLWITYADAQKGFANEKYLQFISGAVYAQYIITNVISIILIICGVLFGAMFSTMVDDSDFIIEFTKQLEQFGINPVDISQFVSYMTVWFIGGIVAFAGAIMLLFNNLMVRKIHRFAKSVYMGIMYQNTEFENPRTVRNWFIFIAVCSGITVIGSIAAGPLVIISNACTLAITIMVIILLDKYFVK